MAIGSAGWAGAARVCAKVVGNAAPFVLTVVLTSVSMALRALIRWRCVRCCVVCVYTNLLMIVRTLRSGFFFCCALWLSFPCWYGYPVGRLCWFVCVCRSTAYADRPGETQSAQGHDFTP